MRYYRFPENRIWKLLFAAFLLLQLFLTRSGMSSGLLGFAVSQMLMIGTIVVAGIVFLAVNRRQLKPLVLDCRLSVALMFAAAILLPMPVKQDWQLMYFTILLGSLLGVFLTYFVTLQETAKCYVLIMCGLSLYSLAATYLFRQLPDRGILEVPQFINAAGNAYYNFGATYVSITHVASRNLGFFREPGVYQFFLLIGLYLTNYCVQWKRAVHMWLVSAILAATLLSTMATGGVISLGLYIIIVFFEKKLYTDRRILWLAIAAAVGAVLVVLISIRQQNALYWFLYDTLVEKFVNKTDSVTERAAAISANLCNFLRSPLVGVPLAEVLHGVSNNTVSTLILFAGCGIAGGALNVLCWLVLVWKKERSVWANLALLLVLFMGFNTQNLTWDLFFWVFPVMAFTEKIVPVLMKKGRQ